MRTIFSFESAIGGGSQPPGRELVMLLFGAIQAIGRSVHEPTGRHAVWTTTCQVDGQSLFVLLQELVEAEELYRRHFEAERLSEGAPAKEHLQEVRTWVGTTGRNFELWSRLLGRGDGPLSRLCAALDSVLQSNGGIRNLRWYTEQEWVEHNSRARP